MARFIWARICFTRFSSDDQRFDSHLLSAVELLAACKPGVALGKNGAIEIGDLASYPLLLLDSGFSIRRTFDAACRLAGLKPNVSFESRAPHTLLAMAEAGQGVAIVPSALRMHPYRVRLAGVTYRAEPLREQLAMFWDKRRPLPRYATAFCEMLADICTRDLSDHAAQYKSGRCAGRRNADKQGEAAFAGAQRRRSDAQRPRDKSPEPGTIAPNRAATAERGKTQWNASG